MILYDGFLKYFNPNLEKEEGFSSFRIRERKEEYVSLPIQKYF
jgi:hypothetical protein